MSAEAAAKARESLTAARAAREALVEAKADLHTKQLRYLRDARRAGWDWKRIATELGVTPQAVHGYWQRHGISAGRIGD